MPIIKRYPNRKLYNTDSKQYITLDGIAQLIREGEAVQVVDHKTDEDLTAVTLTQIIFEQEKKKGGFLPTSVLTGLVQAGGDTFNTLRRSLTNSLDLLRHVDDEIEKRVQTLINRGELAQEEGESLRQKLLNQGKRAAERVLPNEEDVEQMLKARGIPTRRELDVLTEQIALLSNRLDSLIEEEAE